jgi:hypothetical protein
MMSLGMPADVACDVINVTLNTLFVAHIVVVRRKETSIERGLKEGEREKRGVKSTKLLPAQISTHPSNLSKTTKVRHVTFKKKNRCPSKHPRMEKCNEIRICFGFLEQET